MAWPSRSRVPHRRQSEAPLIAQTFQQLSAFLVLQFSVRSFPLQQFAHGARNFRDSQAGIILRHLPHQLQLLLREEATTEAHRGNNIPQVFSRPGILQTQRHGWTGARAPSTEVGAAYRAADSSGSANSVFDGERSP
ncbi:MAG: hypothetical protein DMG55_25810 [Acidobacteria bacterium]|nr:MAG: hypothetical protein DMG55_25810 [Acidobacteriota bacterium]